MARLEAHWEAEGRTEPGAELREPRVVLQENSTFR